MQFLGEHHKGFLYVDQIWTNSPGSSSWGEYLFKTADYDAKAVDAELQEVKRLLEVERLENGYYDENE